MLGGKEAVKSSKASKGISTASMKALISADSAINQVEAQGAVKANMKGEAGILETEIKLDSARGKDVEKKQEELADIEARTRDIESAQMDVINRANKEIDKSAESDDKHTTIASDKNNKTDKANNALIPVSCRITLRCLEFFRDTRIKSLSKSFSFCLSSLEKDCDDSLPNVVSLHP